MRTWEESPPKADECIDKLRECDKGGEGKRYQIFADIMCVSPQR